MYIWMDGFVSLVDFHSFIGLLFFFKPNFYSAEVNI